MDRALRASGSAAIALLAASTIAWSACPGVSHSDVTGSTWRTHAFEDPSSKAPLTVEIGISEVGGGTTVQYFDGSSWHTVNGPTTVDGEQVRVSASGSAYLSYVFDQCGDDIQLPEHDD